MELHTTSAKAPSPVCSLIASKLRERIYAPHGRQGRASASSGVNRCTHR
jgi:hypothetical protein